MKYVELFLVGGTRLGLFFNGNLSVLQTSEGRVKVEDGTHGNGGWDIADTYDNTVQKIFNAKDIV
jgi:hypothetical protein